MQRQPASYQHPLPARCEPCNPPPPAPRSQARFHLTKTLPSGQQLRLDVDCSPVPDDEADMDMPGACRAACRAVPCGTIDFSPCCVVYPLLACCTVD